MLNSSNEYEVDDFAQKLYVSMGYPLTESVRALTTILSNDNTSHRRRAQAQYIRAQQYDNNNSNSNFTSTMTTQANPTIFDNAAPFYADMDFLGLGKNAKAKKQARIEKRQAKNENIRSKAQSRLELAKLGVSEKALGAQNARNMLGGVLGAVTSLAGGDGAAIANTLSVQPDTSMGAVDSTATYGPDPRSLPGSPDAPGIKKYLPYIIGGVLLLGGILFFALKKK